MSHAIDVALALDEEMLGVHGVAISSPFVADSALPVADLSLQLGGRCLIKYVRAADRNRYSVTSGITHFPGVHYLTPTPICGAELVATLNLPPFETPRFALLLDPLKLVANGPRKIRTGRGYEYVLLNGFGVDAIVKPGWPVKVG